LAGHDSNHYRIVIHELDLEGGELSFTIGLEILFFAVRL